MKKRIYLIIAFDVIINIVVFVSLCFFSGAIYKLNKASDLFNLFIPLFVFGISVLIAKSTGAFDRIVIIAEILFPSLTKEQKFED